MSGARMDVPWARAWHSNATKVPPLWMRLFLPMAHGVSSSSFHTDAPLTGRGTYDTMDEAERDQHRKAEHEMGFGMHSSGLQAFHVRVPPSLPIGPTLPLARLPPGLGLANLGFTILVRLYHLCFSHIFGVRSAACPAGIQSLVCCSPMNMQPDLPLLPWRWSDWPIHGTALGRCPCVVAARQQRRGGQAAFGKFRWRSEGDQKSCDRRAHGVRPPPRRRLSVGRPRAVSLAGGGWLAVAGHDATTKSSRGDIWTTVSSLVHDRATENFRRIRHSCRRILRSAPRHIIIMPFFC